MNNDLISRSGLGVDFCNPDVFENKAYAEGWNSLIKIIKEAPSVDAEPVRHGRWKLETKRLASCSSCGMLRDIETQTAWCYCPNCGAKMMENRDV